MARRMRIKAMANIPNLNRGRPGGGSDSIAEKSPIPPSPGSPFPAFSYDSTPWSPSNSSAEERVPQIQVPDKSNSGSTIHDKDSSTLTSGPGQGKEDSSSNPFHPPNSPQPPRSPSKQCSGGPGPPGPPSPVKLKSPNPNRSVPPVKSPSRPRYHSGSDEPVSPQKNSSSLTRPDSPQKSPSWNNPNRSISPHKNPAWNHPPSPSRSISPHKNPAWNHPPSPSRSISPHKNSAWNHPPSPSRSISPHKNPVWNHPQSGSISPHKNPSWNQPQSHSRSISPLKSPSPSRSNLDRPDSPIKSPSPSRVQFNKDDFIRRPNSPIKTQSGNRFFSPLSPAAPPTSLALVPSKSSSNFGSPSFDHNLSNSSDQMRRVCSPAIVNTGFGGSSSGFSEAGTGTSASLVSSDTLRQRLQKGSNLSTSKYSTTRKEFLIKFMDKKPEPSELTILHYTFYNPPSDRKSAKSQLEEEEEAFFSKNAEQYNPFGGLLESEPRDKKKTSQSQESVEPDLDPPVEAASSVGPRVKVGPNGELIIDEQSLVVETSESQRAKKHLEEIETVSGAGYEVGSSGFYRHKRNPKRGGDWTSKETVKFYRALSLCGTDFSMMTHLFPLRSRAELKAKFKREDRRNPVQISQALACQIFDPMDKMTSSEDEEKEDFCIPPPPPPQKRNRIRSKKRSSIEDILFDEEASELIIPDEVQNSARKEPLDDFDWGPTVRKKTVVPKSKATKGRPRKIFDRKIEDLPNKEKTGKPKPKPDEPVTVKVNSKKRKRTISKPEGEKSPGVASPHSKSKELLEPSDASEPVLSTHSELLRFDPNDPLGFNVIPNVTQSVEAPGAEVILDVPNRPDIPHQIFELQPASMSDNSTDLPSKSSADIDTTDTGSGLLSTNTQENKTETTSAGGRHRRSLKVKPVPRPPRYRVPGPGGKAIDTSSSVDEIEIEITCL